MLITNPLTNTRNHNQMKSKTVQKYRVFFVTLLALFAFLLPAVVHSEEVLIYEDTVNIGQTASMGQEISWQHTIPPGILAQVTRVEATVGAADVDYPNCSQNCASCSQDQCEHDRLYVNGSEIGLLQGTNNAPQANPINIPISLLQDGTNTYRVVNEAIATPANWVVTINNSRLKLYAEKNSGISIEKKQLRSTLLPGQEQSYTITVTNNGTANLTGIKVTDQLDENLRYKTSSSIMRHSQKGNNHFWTLASLAPGKSVKIKLVADLSDEVLANIGVSNTATLTTNEFPTQTSNTVTTLSSFIPVEPDGLLVSKRVNRRESRVGKILVYQVTVENRSNGSAYQLVLDDYLPSGFSFVSGSTLKDGQRFQDPDGTRRLRWNLGTLPAGQSIDIRYQAIIGSNVKRGQNTNQATVSAVDGGGTKLQGADKATVMIGGGDIEIPAEIKAQVFLDNNKNGLQNSDDKPMSQVTVLLSKGEKRVTADDGIAHFKDLVSGFYALSIDPRSLPEHISILGDSTHLLRLMEGEQAKISLPVKKDRGPARLNGIVYLDKNKNGQYDQGEQTAKAIKISLDGKLITRSQQGRYLFTRIESGSHLLEVKMGANTIKHQLELAIGNNEFDIALPAGGLMLSIEEK